MLCHRSRNSAGLCDLCFHRHIDYTFYHSLKVLGLIRYVTSSLSSRDNVLVLYNTRVLSKHEYVSAD
jgi:hypothetical protein